MLTTSKPRTTATTGRRVMAEACRPTRTRSNGREAPQIGRWWAPRRRRPSPNAPSLRRTTGSQIALADSWARTASITSSPGTVSVKAGTAQSIVSKPANSAPTRGTDAASPGASPTIRKIGPSASVPPPFVGSVPPAPPGPAAEPPPPPDAPPAGPSLAPAPALAPGPPGRDDDPGSTGGVGGGVASGRGLGVGIGVGIAVGVGVGRGVGSGNVGRGSVGSGSDGNGRDGSGSVGAGVGAGVGGGGVEGAGEDPEAETFMRTSAGAESSNPSLAT